ncbi:AraC family transcriptional regulator [Zhongshania sp.]|uniref:helix-turn-helix transcriptional regulator n=1 Tax=Zhongshania sp. TaxID=1971902 RepID=UPI001B76F89F|nr:AraC family transcriptional regulator [Zhongshania sp.]MBQ0796888.1 helix-turn-helix transcriptional regulator [Zhongshania sp.]
MTIKTKPISVKQAQTQANLVIHAIELPGAKVELCAFPELQAETIVVTEQHSVLSLGLSRLLEQAEGRYTSFKAPRFRRFGTLNFRPADIPFEVRVSQGKYHTIRCRFNAKTLQDLGITTSELDEAQLEACFDIHAPRIEDAMMRLADEVANQSSDSPTLIAALLTTIAVDLSRYIHDAKLRELPHRGGLAPRHLRLVFARLDQLGAPPSIAEMAELCGLSRYHFMRAFKESIGESPSNYAQKILMARARALIASSERPLGEIAQELGYTSNAAFSAAFRRHCGRSPRAWRACLR